MSLRTMVRAFVSPRVRHEFRRFTHGRRVALGAFHDASDPLVPHVLASVKSGDWVIDVGAAVGNFAIPLGERVGPNGRVIALEPTSTHFDLLTSNVQRAALSNITCLQVAAGTTLGTVGMVVPDSDGAADWYLAHVDTDGPMRVLCVPIDALPIPERIALIKVDAEGHDLAVLEGATKLIARDRPVIVVEGDGAALRRWLEARGYVVQEQPGSPNRLWRPAGASRATE